MQIKYTIRLFVFRCKYKLNECNLCVWVVIRKKSSAIFFLYTCIIFCNNLKLDLHLKVQNILSGYSKAIEKIFPIICNYRQPFLKSFFIFLQVEKKKREENFC